jgi:MarR family transcriptional regulator, organic hydroperoxide resistance regulator
MDQFTDLKFLARFSQLYRGLMDTYMDEICLHRAQASVLWSLFDGDGMTQSELGEQLCVQGATITNMLQRMEESGLIVRRRDPEDNRLVRVYLTDTGREKEQQIVNQFSRLDTALFEGMSQEERRRLIQLLTRMVDAMQKLNA